ncbi:ABC transporter ATP-binding protein [Pseudoroseomonas cervicalis]|uniref:ABC transporter ATP-binding protein n=1 Tax=Teichococcus cervicalis TaxID=204525 RepID=UPI002789344F|nr:ABC transporter ATP-binding protein [Pseudoroseomonas cervicalis]MDQ1079234.1 ABC-type glutathione transport system ATPase component [Pseudoroseomonas cervicalis]
MTRLLTVDSLTVALPPGADRPHAVEDLSLHLDAGEILCVVGESGSGKSITANTVMGLLPKGLPVKQGRISFEGEDILGLSAEALRSRRGRRMAMVFQEPMTALNPLMKVGDQIAEALQVHGKGSEAKARVPELLAAVNLPDPAAIARMHPFRLSGGQRQRVMIAMALALEPALLIADEPTTALDVTTQMQILRLIREIQSRKGMGVMFITHDFGVVAEIADRVAVMQRGRIVEQGPAAEILNRPQHPYTRALIAAVPHGAPPERAAIRPAPVLSLQGVTKTYQRGGWFGARATVKAVHDADFTLNKGETLGLVGESGSGKSTLARCVVRLVEPEQGEILFHGKDLRPLSRQGWLPYRRRIQMVFQDPYASLNPRRKVGDAITEGPVTHGVPLAEARERARELLRLVRLDPSAMERYPHEFSGGQRQRIGLARALAMQPELLIADEPVSALDVSVQAQVLELLAEIRQRLGLTMLFITHDLRVAAQICDRIAVMRRGAIVEQGPTSQVFGAPKHEYTRALLDSIPGREWTPPALSESA